MIATIVLLLPALSAAQTKGDIAAYAARPWRVCVTDMVVPPYLNNDSAKLGLAERLLIDAGERVGLRVQLLRYPLKRCRLIFENEGAEAVIAAPIAGNLTDAMQFPMKGGAVDVSRRVVRLDLIGVKRAESPFEWDGHALSGGRPQDLVAGTRLSFRAASEPVRALGFKLDDTALNTRQLLMKLLARRIDMAVATREDVESALKEPQLSTLVMLPTALSTSDFYAVVRPQLPPHNQAQVEAWWTEIGRLRDQPDYRSR